MSGEKIKLKREAAKKERLAAPEMVSFSMGAFGKDMAGNLVGSYYMFFITQVIGLNAAIVGAVFAFSRLLFAFTAPFAGTLIDNTRTPIGKYRPWILVSVIVGSASIFSMYMNLEIQDTLKYIFYLSFYFFWEIASMVLDISFWSFLPTITYNPNDRNTVTALAKVTSGVGGVVIMAGVPVFLSFFFKDAFNPMGYAVLSIGVTAFMLTGGLMVYFINRERVRVDSDIIKIKDLFRSLFDNDQLIAFVISFMLINMGTSLTANFAMYFFAYDVGDMRYFSVFALLVGLGQGIGLMTYPVLAKRISIRMVFIISMITSVVGYFLMLLVGLFLGTKSIALLCAAAVIALFSGGWFATASQAILLDITDYGEYKLGNRTSSVVFSANAMAGKINASVVVLIVGLVLSATGLQGLESGSIPVMSDSSRWLIRGMMIIAPIILIGISLIIFLKTYRLNNKEMAKIEEALEERRLYAEIKREKKEERKILSLKLKEARQNYKKENRSQSFRLIFKSENAEKPEGIKDKKEKTFKRVKKVYIESIKKRLESKVPPEGKEKKP